MRFGKFVLATALLTLAAVPVMAEEPITSIRALENLQAESASMSQELIRTPLEQRIEIGERLQARFEAIVESVDYNALSTLDDNKLQYFTKLSERFENFIKMIMTQDDLTAPFQGNKA